jgi:hypothetical protein
MLVDGAIIGTAKAAVEGKRSRPYNLGLGAKAVLNLTLPLS